MDIEKNGASGKAIVAGDESEEELPLAPVGGSEWWTSDGPVPPNHNNAGLTRNWFPRNFIFGSGSASFQVEGGYAKGGKALSIWDDFSMRLPWKIADGSNGTLACDMYNRYKDDIKVMKQLGFDAYRFSISWPRILPGGRCSAGISQEGIDYYNEVIKTVLDHGMKPFVTLFHWDLPLCLEQEYGGFMAKRIKDDFLEFAEVCFWEFGDRVKYWSTLNEPWTYAVHGYVNGSFPPGKKLPVLPQVLARKIPLHRDLSLDETPTPLSSTAAGGGDSPFVARPSDAYTVARNLLIAHAEAVHLYRTKFQAAQHGQIGIVLCTHWFTPFDETIQDTKAVKRALDFMLGWFLNPVLHGSYPENMINFVPPDNLASFTPQESRKLKGSLDFLGINYYTTQYAADDPYPTEGEGYYKDMQVMFAAEKNGVPIGTPSGSDWLFSVPWGIYELLKYVDDTYPELKDIYITENGYSTKNDFRKTARMVCDDDENRAKYHQDHLANILKSMKDNKKLKGYFMWSWCDNYEWAEGYTVRFGLIYVDYMNDLTRYPKGTASWFAKFLRSKGEPPKWFHPWWRRHGKRLIAQEGGEDESADKRLKLVEIATPV